MDDQDVNQILIVTQKPRRILSKHPQGDRTSGSHQSRTKMTAEVAQAIDDGLYYYEQVEILLFYYIHIILLCRICSRNTRTPVTYQEAKRWHLSVKWE